jgi:hypothetical protein
MCPSVPSTHRARIEEHFLTQKASANTFARSPRTESRDTRSTVNGRLKLSTGG